jgi:hypothetical protein
LTDGIRAEAYIRVAFTSRSDGDVEKKMDEWFHNKRGCKVMLAMTL